MRGCPEKVDASRSPAPAGERLVIRVDRRIELFATLEHLAGGREYAAFPSPYTRALDAHMAPFRAHRAVAATAELRARYGIGHDAPLTLAIELDDDLAPDALSPLPEGVDSRWRGAPVAAYLEAVRDFAASSGFAAFLASQAPFIAAVEGRYRELLATHPILSWFDEIFGVPASTSYLLAPGLLVGPWSYGVHVRHPDGSVLIAEVVSLEGADADGLPRLGEQTHAMLAHELAHSYVNPILDARRAELGVAAAAFAEVQAAMARQAYPEVGIFVDESVVRAVTVLYLQERESVEAAARSLAQQDQLSFRWTRPIAAALAERRARNGRISADDLVAAARAGFAP